MIGAVIGLAVVVLALAGAVVVLARRPAEDPSVFDAHLAYLAAELTESHASHRETLVQYRNQMFSEAASHSAERDKLMGHIESVLAAANADRAQMLSAVMVATGREQSYGALKIAEKRDPNLAIRADAARHGVRLAPDAELTDDDLDDVLRSGRSRGRGFTDTAVAEGLVDEDGNVIIPVGAAGD